MVIDTRSATFTAVSSIKDDYGGCIVIAMLGLISYLIAGSLDDTKVYTGFILLLVSLTPSLIVVHYRRSVQNLDLSRG